MMLSAALPDQAELVMQDLQRLDADISAQRTVVSQALETLATAQLLSPPTGYPPPQPLPVPLPYPTSSRARPSRIQTATLAWTAGAFALALKGGSPSPRTSSPPALTR